MTGSGAGTILGISAFYHDSAACLLRDGKIVAAAEEERFSRKKGDGRFPRAAIEYCLREAKITAGDLEGIVYYDKPLLSFTRLIESYLEHPFGSFSAFKHALPRWTREKLRIPRLIEEFLPEFRGDHYFTRHHESHAASAFFCSPFEQAAIIVVDGVGEWACTSVGEGRGNELRLLKEVRFPHSLGLFYSAMAQYLGFRIDSEEYKVMGLAAFGEPCYANALRDEVIDLKEDGSLALNLRYFDFTHKLRMINPRLAAYLAREARVPGGGIERFHMDFAASVQAVATETMLRLARTAKKITGHGNLCLAGGVALNCVANGAIYREGLFDGIYVQPAAGDAGGAVGAALQVWHQALGHPRKNSSGDLMAGACLGPAIEQNEVLSYLKSLPVPVQHESFPDDILAQKLAGWLAEGQIIALCKSRMEFGPRALGTRSILGDPRDPRNHRRINQKIKFRESFRPFAPAILEERVSEFFDIAIPSPYMLFVMPLRDEKRGCIPAVTHVDQSVRLQTVALDRSPFFHRLISEFDRITGCPMLLNTSFNIRGEPLVCDHEDAYRCFATTDIDILVLGNCVIKKSDLARKGGV